MIANDAKREFQNKLSKLGLTEVRRCDECEGEVHEHWAGDEGWSICESCRAIEGKSTIYFEDNNGDRRLTEDELYDLMEKQ